jgi:hypothetical protein
MNKNLQHSKKITKAFSIQKQQQEPSTSLRTKIRTFNLQEQKQKSSTSLRAKTRTLNL